MTPLLEMLQGWITEFGFYGYTFIDAGHPDNDLPYYHCTAGEKWEAHYRDMAFVRVDPVLAAARRRNLPFLWRDVALPPPVSGPRSGSLKTMDAASDFGFKDGLMFPHHTVDALGRPQAALLGLFWRDEARRLDDALKSNFYGLQMLLNYWQEQATRLSPINPAREHVISGDTVLLSDRERDILAWAGRGKTAEVTAEILHLSVDTVENHIRNAMRKLGVVNKTHAVVRAIYLKLIDP